MGHLGTAGQSGKRLAAYSGSVQAENGVPWSPGAAGCSEAHAVATAAATCSWTLGWNMEGTITPRPSSSSVTQAAIARVAACFIAGVT
jgi:hypothetical protein